MAPPPWHSNLNEIPVDAVIVESLTTEGILALKKTMGIHQFRK
jgi:hypothetical protein